MWSVRYHMILITLTKRSFNTQSNGCVFVISQSIQASSCLMWSVRYHVILITLTERSFNTQSNGYIFVISQSTNVTRRHLFVLRKNFFFFSLISQMLPLNCCTLSRVLLVLFLKKKRKRKSIPKNAV